MNERIKELAEQAGVGDNWNKADWYSMSPEMLEKFAELLVKETMQVVANNLPQNTYLDVADAVIEHFGVGK